jgi:hypothetical protein
MIPHLGKVYEKKDKIYIKLYKDVSDNYIIGRKKKNGGVCNILEKSMVSKIIMNNRLF